MPSICTPSRRAWSAWPSSCRISDVKKHAVAAAPIAVYTQAERSGVAAGNSTPASDHRIRTKIPIHVQLIPISTPATRAIVIVEASTPPLDGRRCVGAGRPGAVAVTGGPAQMGNAR
jgi:hypothetical protein